MPDPTKPKRPDEAQDAPEEEVHTADPGPKPETPGGRVVEEIDPDEMDPDQVRTPI